MGILLQVLLHQTKCVDKSDASRRKEYNTTIQRFTKSLNGLLNTGPGAVAASETLVIDTPTRFPLRKI